MNEKSTVLNQVQSVVDALSGYLWQGVTWLLILAGLYFCFRTIVVQVRYLPAMFGAITE